MKPFFLNTYPPLKTILFEANKIIMSVVAYSKLEFETLVKLKQFYVN